MRDGWGGREEVHREGGRGKGKGGGKDGEGGMEREEGRKREKEWEGGRKGWGGGKGTEWRERGKKNRRGGGKDGEGRKRDEVAREEGGWEGEGGKGKGEGRMVMEGWETEVEECKDGGCWEEGGREEKESFCISSFILFSPLLHYSSIPKDPLRYILQFHFSFHIFQLFILIFPLYSQLLPLLSLVSLYSLLHPYSSPFNLCSILHPFLFTVSFILPSFLHFPLPPSFTSSPFSLLTAGRHRLGPPLRDGRARERG